jgi:HSP20 family molecular chaperone IbpA
MIFALYSIDLDIGRITAHLTSDGMLVIEVPIRNSKNEGRLAQAENNKNQSLTQSDQSRHSLSAYINLLMNADFHPRIVDKDNNEKLLEMTIDVKKCKPEEIKISVKDNELIIEGEHKYKENRYSKRSRFFKSTTLPVGAQVNQISTKLRDDGQMKIEVPLLL